VIILDEQEKKVTSSKGHDFASTSLFNDIRISQIPSKRESLRQALSAGDFQTVSEIAQEDALLMHAIMLTSDPKIKYINSETVAVISDFLRFKSAHKLSAFWTLDAGPNVHILYQKETEDKLLEFLRKIKSSSSVSKILLNNSNCGFRYGQKSYFELVNAKDFIIELS